MTFRDDYYQKLKDLFEELSEKENGVPLIWNAREGMDCSVLKVGCAEVDIWQVSANDAIDTDNRELLALV